MFKFKKEAFFFMGYGLMLASQMFENVIFIAPYKNYLTYIGFLLILIYIIFNKNQYSQKNFWLFALCLFIFTIVSFNVNDKKMLKLVTMIIAFQGISFEKFIKKDFNYRLLFVFIIVFLSFLSLTYNNDVIRSGGESIRYALGFQHPNNFAVYTMLLALEFIYLHRNDKKWKQFLFLFIIFIINYFFTDSRAAMVIEILMFIYLIIPYEIITKILENAIVKLGVIFSFLILLIISVFLALNYSDSNYNWIYKIDKITSGRISLAGTYIKKYPLFSVFGNELPQANRYIELKENPNYLALDNGYIHLILEFGILVTVIFLIFYFLSVKKLYTSREYCLISILFFLNFYLVMEATTFNVLYNPFLMIFSIVFYDQVQSTNHLYKKSKEGSLNET